MRYRYDKATDSLVPVEDAAPEARVYVRGDLPAYISPLSEPGKPIWIDGRAARREELRRNDLREVDPSEWKGR